ncbi:S1/P1 nuclease [Tsukamurella sputi]|uniref:S1/P1 nuclease n=1 Tax=Tsukamurella sputi TaxID=2591848 RepID=A0A5C5RVR5_9ACTN|nr:S1/P1 nuclease [Tsukamurella sputi]TWS26603.1 S1/P1 nuclease [Tsukamurella sputi]
MKRIAVGAVAAVLVAGTATVAAGPASAWGVEGHRIVADVAQAELTPTAAAQATSLLDGGNLASVASWADDTRSAATAPWHYINMGENGCKYNAGVNGNGGSNVIDAIRNQTAILADRSKSRTDRANALKYLVHFVGDIEQPLHTGYAKDRGGNSTVVTYNGKSTNLHALWDSGLLTAATPAAVAALPAPDPGSTDPVAWAEASCDIAVTVYPASSTIDSAYVAKYTPVLEKQLRLGGARLARLLNGVLTA